MFSWCFDDVLMMIDDVFDVVFLMLYDVWCFFMVFYDVWWWFDDVLWCVDDVFMMFDDVVDEVFNVVWRLMFFHDVLWCLMMFWWCVDDVLMLLYDVLCCLIMFHDVWCFLMIFYDVWWCFDVWWCLMMFWWCFMACWSVTCCFLSGWLWFSMLCCLRMFRKHVPFLGESYVHLQKNDVILGVLSPMPFLPRTSPCNVPTGISDLYLLNRFVAQLPTTCGAMCFRSSTS